MATLDEISAEDFVVALKNDPKVFEKYFSLAGDKKVKYKIGYKSNFSKEFRILERQLMKTAGIDSKSASQILLREIKKTHEKGGFFMQSSGNIDRDSINMITEKIKRDVENGKYDILISRNKAKIANINKENESIQQFDLSTSEGKKEFLDNLYKGYSECKTKEEKINYIEKNYGISLKNMSESQKEQVISKVDERSEIRKIKDSLSVDEIIKLNPNKYGDEKKRDELLEKIAAKKYAKKNGKDVNEVIKNNNLMREVEEIDVKIEQYKMISKKNNNNNNKNNEKIKELEEEREKRFFQLGLSNEERNKKIEIEKDRLNNQNSKDNVSIEKNLLDNISNESDLIAFLDNDENKIEENLEESQLIDDLFEIPEEEFNVNLEENKFSNIEVKEENRIIKFLKNIKNRLTQKKLPEGQDEKLQEGKHSLTKNEYNQENKKSIFERIKNSLTKLVHRNKKDVLAIDTAENNTKVTGMEKEKPWRLENYGTTSMGKEEPWRLENYGTTRNAVNKKMARAIKEEKKNNKVINKDESVER